MNRNPELLIDPAASDWFDRWLPALIAAAGVVLAFALQGYQLLQATNIIAFSIAILGLNLLAGYNGQISLGQGAFVAMGGYTAAILMHRFGVPFWLAVPVSGLTSMALGYLIAIPAVRLELLYLALATFSLAVALPQVAKNKLLAAWTGGVEGLPIPRPQPWDTLGLNLDQTIYLYALLVAIVVFVLVRNLTGGRIGRALQAIKDQPVAAETMAIDTRFYKRATFAVSAFLTGVGGGIGAVATGFVSADSYNFFISITLLVGAVIGGFRSIFGSIFGAAFIVLLPMYAEKVAQGAAWATFGAVTILTMWVMPEGFAGLYASVRARLRSMRKAGALHPAPVAPDGALPLDGGYP